MHLRNALSVVIAAGVLATFAGVSASAQVENAFATYTGNSANNTSYSGTSLTIGSPPSGTILSKSGFGLPVIDSTASIVFGPLTNLPGTFTNGPGGFDQGLSGGSFTIKDGATILLQGMFGPSIMHGVFGASSGTVTLSTNSVVYGGVGGPGTFFPTGILDPNNGVLSVLFNVTDSGGFAPVGPVGSPTGVHSFTASDSITFSAPTITANSTPEASSLALLLPGLIPLAVCLRRRRAVRA